MTEPQPDRSRSCVPTAYEHLGHKGIWIGRESRNPETFFLLLLTFWFTMCSCLYLLHLTLQPEMRPDDAVPRDWAWSAACRCGLRSCTGIRN